VREAEHRGRDRDLRRLEELAPAKDNPALCKQGGIARYRDLIAYIHDRPGHDRRYAINCDKIKRELGGGRA